jgi:hypothetical protein
MNDRDASPQHAEHLISQSSNSRGPFSQVADPQGRSFISYETPGGVVAVVPSPPHMPAESSAGMETMSGDARVLEAINNGDVLNLPNHRVSHSQNNAVTFFYGPCYERVQRAEQSTRTVYVGNVARIFFYDHSLKRMMSQCGDVDSISWLPSSYGGSGQAFVA